MRQWNQLKDRLFGLDDYEFHDIYHHFCNIKYCFRKSLCDVSVINQFFLIPLSQLSFFDFKRFNISFPNCSIQKISYDDIIPLLDTGHLVLFFHGFYALDLASSYNRGISIVDDELSLCGPKDSFIESIDINLGLLYKRIKSSSLNRKSLSIGRYTNTRIDVLFIDGIVKMDLVYHVLETLEKVDIDGVIDSSYLKQSLEHDFHLFPTIMLTQRPDKCSMALLEGKVVVLVDNSPYAIILPSFFFDYLHTTDDYYQKPFNTTFIRIIRLFAFLIAIFTPGIYISVTTRDYSLVPLSLLLVLKSGRLSVPFPAYLEAFFMIVCFEILKESDLRMSATSGSSISILGGLILGEAAVSAGIVSPIMIIVIAISSISGLIFPSIELGNALRFYKVFILILSSLFGIYGVLFGLVILILDLVSTKIFGYSYFSFSEHDLFDSIFLIRKKLLFRNSKLSTNIIRGKYH